MESSVDKDKSREPNKEFEESHSPHGRPGEQPGARRARADMWGIEARRERRERLLEQDALGRTPLFYAAEQGLEEQVREMIYSFRGTGLSPARLKLIATRDHAGLTAADVAEQNGHVEIARLLREEQGRMEYYE